MKKALTWNQYDAALKQRGSINFWISDEIEELWYDKSKSTKGKSKVYSDYAIEVCVQFRLIYNLKLRQTEGFVNSIFELSNIKLVSPDHTTISRRAITQGSPKLNTGLTNGETIDIVIDSTGLKMYGTGEWNETKHGLRKKRQWMKLHLTIDAETLEILSQSLTTNKVGDPTEAHNHLNRLKEKDINEFIADGAYDSVLIDIQLQKQKSEGETKVTVPPPKNATFSDTYGTSPTQRDKHIEYIQEHGKELWKFKTGHQRQLLAENAMGRYKNAFSGSMHARTTEGQVFEARCGSNILNQQIRQGTIRRSAA